MNLEEEIRNYNEGIIELTTSIKEYEAIIETSRKDISKLKQQKQKANTEAIRNEIQIDLAVEMQLLSLAEQHLSGLRGSYNVLQEVMSNVIKLEAEEKFQNSSVHSSLNEGFRSNGGLEILKEFWRLFQIGFSNNIQLSKNVLEKDSLDIVEKYYPEKISKEIDVFLYANPTTPWKLHLLENDSPNMFPFTKKIVETPNWSPAIASLNGTTPYNSPITPPSSREDLKAELLQAHKDLREEATMYIVFELTNSNKNLSVKLRQLESQLAYVIIRFHLRRSTNIPSEKDEFKEFIAKEVLKLIAFAGVILLEDSSRKLLSQAHGAIFGKGNPYPALASLYKNGRLCYFDGATYSFRLSLMEARVDSLCFVKKENSIRHFETMDEFYDSLIAELDEEFKEDLPKLTRHIFQEQGIGVKMLYILTDEKLKEYGITQMGLREAILYVLGK